MKNVIIGGAIISGGNFHLGDTYSSNTPNTKSFDKEAVYDFVGKAKIKQALEYVRDFAKESGDNDSAAKYLL